MIKIETDMSWPDRPAFLHWLVDHGFKISRSKLYRDAAGGLLALEQDGSVTGSAAKRYIKLSGLRPLNTPAPADADKLVAIRADRDQLECRKIAAQTEKIKFDLDVSRGRYLPRDEIYTALAGRAAALDAGLTQMIRSAAADIIAVAQGDPNTEAEVTARLIAEKDGLLQDFAASKNIVVEIIGDGDVDDNA